MSIFEYDEEATIQYIRECEFGRGKAEGKAEGIKATLDILLDLNLDKALIVEKLCEKYDLTQEEAKEYYRLHSK